MSGQQVHILATLHQDRQQQEKDGNQQTKQEKPLELPPESEVEGFHFLLEFCCQLRHTDFY